MRVIPQKLKGLLDQINANFGNRDSVALSIATVSGGTWSNHADFYTSSIQPSGDFTFLSSGNWNLQTAL